MNPELRQLLDAFNAKATAYIAAGTAGDADRRAEITQGMQKDFAGIAQPLINVGFAAGRADRDADVTREKTRADAEKARADKAAADLVEIGKTNGDVTKVQAEASKRIEDAEARAKAAEAAAETRVRESLRDRDLAIYEAHLVAAGMDEDYAKAQGILLRTRMTYDKDGALSVMQKGSENIPYSVKGSAELKLVADELVKEKQASPTLFRGTSDRGGGTGNGTGTGGGSDIYKTIQDQQKKAEEVAAASRNGGIAAAYGGSR